MTLYDSKYVYFDWDDKLKGKKGFFADNINDLKSNVKDNRTMFYGEILKSSDSDSHFPFETIDKDGWHAHLRFCYYDPYYEFRKAYLEGEQIQFKGNIDNWVDIAGIPLFNASPDEYRIKPESEYVPFDTVQELINAWDEKYPQNKNRPEGTMPLIWIKEKECNRAYLITDFFFERVYMEYDAGTSNYHFTLKELFENYTFADGSIIGKVKEE